MDSAYLPALAALLGTAIGGLTSFLTTWFTQNAQNKSQRLVAAKTKREELYSQFLNEMARGYARAFTEEQLDLSALVNLFALRGRVVLLGSPPVVEVADNAVKHVMEVYMGPKLAPADARLVLDMIGADHMRRFAEVCRVDLDAFKIP